MRRLRDMAVGRYAQRLFFDAFAATLNDLGLAAVDQRRECLFELAVDGDSHGGRHLAGSSSPSAIFLRRGSVWGDVGLGANRLLRLTMSAQLREHLRQLALE